MDTATFFVTGGSGLVWSHIVEKLIQAHPSSQVHALSRSPVNHFSGATYHACDITSAEAVQKVFDEISPTVVFHAAATGLNLSELEDNVTKINIVGTRNLVEASVKSDVKAFVFTSSMGVVQVHGWKDIWNGDETLPIIDEDSKALHYAYTKAEGERMVMAQNTTQKGGLRTCSLRPGMIYGERDNHVVPATIKVLRAGGTENQTGDNSNWTSTTYAGNCADGHLLAATKLLQESQDDMTLSAPLSDTTPAIVVNDNGGRVSGEAFFLSDGEPIHFWDFSRHIFEAAGQPVDPAKIRVVPRWLAMIVARLMMIWAGVTGGTPLLTTLAVKYTTMTRTVSIDKARRRLGYEPKVAWREGLERGVKWYLHHENTQPSQ